jgi:chromosome segregation ATPase
MLMKSELQTLNINLLPSTDSDNSSVASMYEDCESPLSSWDSEPETDIISLEENYLDMEEQNSDDGLLWEMDNRSYEELLKKFIEKEEELRVSNLKLQLSEHEIIKLNVQLNNVRQELNLKQEELQVMFYMEKHWLKRELTSKLEDCDSRNKELENKLSQYEAEKMKQEELHAAKQKRLQDGIISLVEDYGQRMIELEKANNMIDYLKTEICSRDDKISNMKKFTDDVKTTLKELIIEVYNLKFGMV